jgi:hypothetical protein
MNLEDIRRDLESRILRIRNVKKSDREPYTYDAKSKSKDKIKIQFGTETFCVYHDGVPTIQKPLKSIDIDEIYKYVAYKVAM